MSSVGRFRVWQIFRGEQTMRGTRLAFVLILAFSLAGIAIADEQDRTAVVEDTAGQSTEVTGLHVDVDTRYELCDGSCLAVKTGTLEICIPMENLVSVVQTGELSTVKYVLRGQEFTAKGKLRATSVNGKSDFGGFYISTGNIRRIEFKSPPTPGGGSEVSGSPILKLTLLDGSIVPVTRLRRFYRYFSTEGYIMGGEWKTEVEEAITFIRGESTSSVAMQDIAKVDFGADDTVSVTLRNGKSATGKVSHSLDFCGTFEKGCFVIEKEFIKSIEFVGGDK